MIQHEGVVSIPHVTFIQFSENEGFVGESRKQVTEGKDEPGIVTHEGWEFSSLGTGVARVMSPGHEMPWRILSSIPGWRGAVS